MKARLIIRVAGVVALVTLLGTSPSVWAIPPRTHSVTGVIEAVDYESHSITLKAAKGGLSLRFAWNDGTRFRPKGLCVATEPFQSGRTVKVFYRREVGQLVLREVSLTPPAGARRSRRRRAAVLIQLQKAR